MAVKSSAARVTAADVQEILDTTLEASVINTFINTANTFIEVNLSSANLGEAMLTEIEKWLVAHFLSLRDRRVKSENIAGEYSVTYEVGNLGEGLMFYHLRANGRSPGHVRHAGFAEHETRQSQGVLMPLFTHTCTIQRHDGSVNALNELDPAGWADQLTAVPAGSGTTRSAEPSPQNAQVMLSSYLMLLPASTAVLATDRISNVTTPDGTETGRSSSARDRISAETAVGRYDHRPGPGARGDDSVMATIEEAWKALLAAGANLNVIIGSRVCADALPEGVTVPAATFLIVGDIPVTAHDGDSGLSTAIVQTDFWSTSRLECASMRAAARADLNGMTARQAACG